MTRAVIAIQFPNPATAEMMSRALNFIEDLFRFAEDNSLGSVDDINHYRDGCFLVSVSATRRLGDVRREITRLLRLHMLEEDAVVSRSHKAGESERHV